MRQLETLRVKQGFKECVTKINVFLFRRNGVMARVSNLFLD
jgi:hypothetical protein